MIYIYHQSHMIAVLSGESEEKFRRRMDEEHLALGPILNRSYNASYVVEKPRSFVPNDKGIRINLLVGMEIHMDNEKESPG